MNGTINIANDVFDVAVTDMGRGIKPLCELDEVLLCYKKGTLGTVDKNGKWTPSLRCISGLKAFLGKFRIFERILRLSPRCACALSDKSAIVSHSGRILYVDLQNNTVTPEHTYCKGMSNPLYFGKIIGIQGFEDGFYYGEYTGNPEEKEVAIYKRPFDDKPCEWKKVYEFPAGSITHIHGIVPDVYRNGVIVMTGDTDSGSAVTLFFDNFTRSENIASGSQQSRSCVAFTVEEGIYYATDTPFCGNHLYFASPEGSGKWNVKSVANLDGSCIYGADAGDIMLLNTVVETDSKKKGIRLLFTYKRGKGIADWYTKVYAIDRKKRSAIVLKYKKDIFPMGLCQFGSVSFCSSKEKGSVWISPTAVKKYDGRLLKLKIKELPGEKI